MQTNFNYRGYVNVEQLNYQNANIITANGAHSNIQGNLTVMKYTGLFFPKAIQGVNG